MAQEFLYWSVITAGQYSPDLRTGFAGTLRTELVNRMCGNYVVRNFRLIDGHKLNYGLARWTMSVIFRLIDGHNLTYGLTRWAISAPFVLQTAIILCMVLAMYHVRYFSSHRRGHNLIHGLI